MPLRKYPSASRKSETRNTITQPMSMTISQKTRTNTEREKDNFPEFQQKSLFCITFRGEHLQIKGIWGSMAMQHIRDFEKESEVKRKRKGHTIVDEKWSVQKNIWKANLNRHASTFSGVWSHLLHIPPHVGRLICNNTRRAGKLYKARSRLYRSRLLEVNTKSSFE